MKIARVSLTSYVHLQVGSVLVGDILSHFFIFLLQFVQLFRKRQFTCHIYL